MFSEQKYIQGNINYKCISCDNIPENFLDKFVAKKHFSKFGKINRFIFCPKRLSCTVEYEREEDARSAYENAGNYNGYYFNIQFVEDETFGFQRKEEWINHDPEVQAELDAMGNAQSMQQQHMKLFPSTRPSKSILKPSNKLIPIVPSTFTNMSSSVQPIESSKIGSATKQELEMILRKQALNVEDKFKILDARDKLIRLTTIRTTDIRKAVSTRGTCPDMCPEKERLLRDAKRQVSVFEMDSKFGVMNHKIAIKEYSRSSADQEIPLAHELRPEPVLKMTMTYLMHKIMDMCDDPSVNLGDWYHFVWDRTRSIRKDITQQDLCSLESVKLVEQCARFHIHCAARFISEDPSVFDQKINTENLTKCLQTLKYMYHDLRLKNIICPNESEFRAYMILLNLNDSNFLWELKQLPINIQNSDEVCEALAFYLAIDSNNYVKFFLLVRKTTYMNSCILLRYFNQVRDMAIRIILKAYYSPRFYTISVKYLKSILAFESEEETISFLNHYGLTCDTSSDKVILDKAAFFEPEIPYPMDRSYTIEAKRKTTVGEAICGQRLESMNNFENYIPHNSFDQDGYLNHTAWTAEDQNMESCKEFSEPNNSDSSLFKIPTTSSTILHKQQRMKPTQLGEEFGIFDIDNEPLQKIPIKNRDSSKLSYEINSQDNRPALDLQYSQKSLNDNFVALDNRNTISQTTTTTTAAAATIATETASTPYSNTFTFKKPTESLILESNTNSDFQHTKSQITFDKFDNQEFTELSKSTPKQTFFFGQSVGQNIFSKLQSESFKNIDDKIKTEMKFEMKSEQKELQERNEQKIQEEMEDKRKQLEEESKGIRENKLKEIDINSKLILDEILQDIVSNEIRTLTHNEKLTLLSDDILKEEINCALIEIIQTEVSTLLKDRIILRKYFYLWKRKVQKKLERRKLIESTPVWITERKLSDLAFKYSPSQLNETLDMMERYRMGTPTVCFNFNTLNSYNKIDLFSIISKEIQNRNDIDIGKELINRKIYFKCIISLPEDETLFNSEYESYKGFYEYMSKQLHFILSPDKKTESTIEDGSEFLRVYKDNIYICLRKIYGTHSLKNENGQNVTDECEDSNAMVFIMTCSNLKTSQKRLNRILSSSSLQKCPLNKIPIAIIVYNSTLNQTCIEKELNLKNLISKNLISDYRIFEVNERKNENNLKYNLEESFKYLVKKSKRENCNLEMQNLSSFLHIAIGDEFWNRLFKSWLNNPLFNKFCKRPKNIIQLYNVAIEKLIEIIEKNLDDYLEFPKELKEFISEPLFDNVPVGIEYFPKNWKMYQSEKVYRVKNFLLKIKLQEFTDNVLPEDLNQLEELLLKYAKECIPLDTAASLNAGYSAFKILLEKLNDADLENFPVSSRLYRISWLEIIKNISLQLMISTWNIESKYLPKNIIYEKSLFDDFINLPWWLKIDLLKTMKTSSISYEKDSIEYKPEDESLTPLSKKIKYDSRDFDVILKKGFSVIDKAEKNIEKLRKMSICNRNTSRSLDMKFYYQENINQNIKKFLYENQNK